MFESILGGSRPLTFYFLIDIDYKPITRREGKAANRYKKKKDEFVNRIISIVKQWEKNESENRREIIDSHYQ